MAAKKYYAVKTGRKTGIFSTWADCKPWVDGYAGAEYKGFAALSEAKAYLGEVCVGEEAVRTAEQSLQETVNMRTEAAALPKQGTLLAYVDGSYDDSVKKYAFGCVFLLPDGTIYTEYGNGDKEQSLQLRNVTGEMLGAMFAVKFAIKNGFSKIEIRYDYMGIEKWVTGEWRSKTELTQKYAAAMRKWGTEISISFTKVAAHTNVEYNELADKLAKIGIVKGDGVPRVRLIKDMEQYYGTDSFE